MALSLADRTSGGCGTTHSPAAEPVARSLASEAVAVPSAAPEAEHEALAGVEVEVELREVSFARPDLLGQQAELCRNEGDNPVYDESSPTDVTWPPWSLRSLIIVIIITVVIIMIMIIIIIIIIVIIITVIPIQRLYCP